MTHAVLARSAEGGASIPTVSARGGSAAVNAGWEVFIFSLNGDRPETAPTAEGLAAYLPLCHLASAAAALHPEARGEVIRGEQGHYFYYRVLVPPGSGAPDRISVL